MVARTVKGTDMRRLIALAAAAATVLASCGGDAGGVEVDDPWARTSAMSQSAGAVYMHLETNADDALLGASVDSGVAAAVEIHETTGDDDGMMSMTPVDRIDLPAGEAVVLEPGGYHIMLLDLVEPLEIGTTFDLTLEFEVEGSRTIEVEVRDN